MFRPLLLCAYLGNPPSSQAELNPVWEGLLSSFAVDFEELLQEPTEAFPYSLFEDLSTNIAFDLPSFSSNTQNNKGIRRLQGNIRYNPMTYWYANIDAYYYLKEQSPWEPDFTYSFGYDDWNPYTLSFVYENQSPNRFRPNRAEGERVTHYLHGSYNFGWKFLLADFIAKPMLFDTDNEIACQLSHHFTPRYQDSSGMIQQHKRLWSLHCHYPIYGKWGLNLKFFYYPATHQQQPWDPDYTYELGYFDWEAGAFSVQYKNTSGNRYPWNDRPGDGAWHKGSVHFLWNLAW
jgi:hypothetical protein